MSEDNSATRTEALTVSFNLLRSYIVSTIGLNEVQNKVVTMIMMTKLANNQSRTHKPNITQCEMISMKSISKTIKIS